MDRTSFTRIVLLTSALLLGGVGPTIAQETAPPAPDDQAVTAADARRPCEGCPPRRVGKSFLQATGINVLYGLGNLARGQVTARITPETWWANMQQGMVWDLDDFTVNQIGHPYQGGPWELRS